MMPDLKKILCINLADIGDLVTTTPALDVLRRGFPAATIHMLTTAHAAPILNHTGLVDRVMTAVKFDNLSDFRNPATWRDLFTLLRSLRAEHYDAVFLFRHLTSQFGMIKNALIVLATGAPKRAGLDNGRGWFFTHKVDDLGFGLKHEAQYWVDVAQLLVRLPEGEAPGSLKVGYALEDRQWAEKQFGGSPDTSEARSHRLAVHPGSGGYSLARRWEAEKFGAVANAHDGDVVLIGGRDDQGAEVQKSLTRPAIDMIGHTTLNQLSAMLNQCDEYVGADSGLLHIYNATNPQGNLLALFGPSNHLAYGSSDFNVSHVYVTVRSGALCSPCSYVGHTVGLRNGCEARTCMKMIRPEHAYWNNRATFPTAHVRVSPDLYILGVPINAITFAGLLDTLKLWVEDKTGMPRQVCTVNPEFIIAAQKDVNFYNILNRCHLCLPDGQGLLFAARWLGHPLPERVTGSDGIYLIAARAAREGWRLFLLGAAPGVAEKTAAILCDRYPGLQIAGTYAGNPSADEEDGIVERVNASHADILFVAYGAPKQDKWIARNLPRLQVRVALGVGGSFDFVAGVTQRAPVWMRRLGIEWLHRLIKQPWRWRRILRAVPIFLFAVLRRGARGPGLMTGYARH
jgi:N-acetylglucosaminyldiphosphoundecaprenol N-acetyl-beta-D-mannosaminyltransferase